MYPTIMTVNQQSYQSSFIQLFKSRQDFLIIANTDNHSKLQQYLPGLADCGGWETLAEAICCDDIDTDDADDGNDDEEDDDEDDCDPEPATVWPVLPPPWTARLAWSR